MFHIPTVQLKYQSFLPDKALVLRAAVVALTAKQSLIPATARLNIAHANKWLWMHTDDLCETFSRPLGETH